MGEIFGRKILRSFAEIGSEPGNKIPEKNRFLDHPRNFYDLFQTCQWVLFGILQLISANMSNELDF